MSAVELIVELEKLGVELWETSGELRFRGPKGVMTEERRSVVRQNRDAVLFYLRSQTDDVSIMPAPLERHDPFPLTDVQAAYLLGRQTAFAYGGVGAQVYAEIEIESLDPAKLERAWNKLVARHDMLRAVIYSDGYQQILEEVPVYQIPVRNLQDSDNVTFGEALHRIREAAAANIFTPDRWPLFDLGITHGPDQSVFHISIDFIVADYMSVQLLLNELSVLYNDPDASLPPLTIAFRDYVLAERRQQDRAAYEHGRQYWNDRLKDIPPAPELPLLGQDITEGGTGFERHSFALDEQVWAAFRTRAGRSDLTPSVAVLAAYAAVIGRWSRSERFTLNLTLLNRKPLHPEVGHLVGDFTTVSLLAVTRSAENDFVSQAKAIQDQLWRDMDHRQFSGVEVMRELGRQRGAGEALMPVIFTSTIGLDETSSELGLFLHGMSQTPQVWIDCQAIERDGCLILNWDVRRGVFPEGVAKSMFSSMEDLIHRLAADDAAWADNEGISVPYEQQQARKLVNATEVPMPEGLLYDAFFAAAATEPKRIALIQGDVQLSYGELATAARRLSRALNRAGCRSGECVAVALDKGWQQIASVLAIQLAGAAYLPLDPQQPPLRRDGILHDAEVKILVTDKLLDWPEEVTILGPETRDGDDPDDEFVPPLLDPSSLAYVIYTSGSTGSPKGVMISHQAALNTIQDINLRLQIGKADRVLGLASLAFDLSVYDIFGPLSVGGALVLPEAELRDDPLYWCSLIERHGITLWNSVPAQMQMLIHVLDTDPQLELPSLSRAMLSGDWIPLALAANVRSRLPHTALYGLGGATEAAIWSIIHPITEMLPGWSSIPYGVPLANQMFHVLDSAMTNCPDWVPGELYIGGSGVALGYLGDPSRTAQRFVHHPVTGERLYRTGDMGRYRPGGVIEFLGRDDLQVKIRGYRIELAEVEAAFRDCPGIAAATVLVAGENQMERRLVGFVQPGMRENALPDLVVPAMGDQEGDRYVFAAFVQALDHVSRLEFVCALQIAGSFPETGIWGDDEAIATAIGVQPTLKRLLRRWLAVLADAGLLHKESASGSYACNGLPSEASVARAWTKVDNSRRAAGVGETITHYLAIALRQIGPLLHGEVAANALLFPEGKTEFIEAVYHDSLIGRYLNTAVIRLVRQAYVERSTKGPLHVLEIGAGVGGTSAALIPALSDLDVDYLFTDISRFFLNLASDRFVDFPFLRFGTLDLNQDFYAQGYNPNSADVIVACNVLHNARNLSSVLREISRVLRPGGLLVVVETVDEIPWTMASMEFMIDGDGHLANDGQDDKVFIDGDAWIAALEESAGDYAVCLPPSTDPISAMGQRVFAIRFKTDRADVDERSVSLHVASRLPPYMVPQQIEFVDALPLTANGKVDRVKMAGWLRHKVDKVEGKSDAPRDELEERLADLWCAVLGLPMIGREENFFQIGGDSLLISQLTSRLHAQFPEASKLLFSQTMRQILHQPTIAALADFLRQSTPLSEQELVEAAPASPLVPLGSSFPGVPCVLVHDLGGTMAPYVHLIRELDGKLPLVGLAVTKVPIYLNRSPKTLITSLADEYVNLLVANPPAHLVGFGTSGLLAMAIGSRMMERSLQSPIVTLIGGCEAPVKVDDELLLEYAFCRFIGADPARAGYPEEMQLLHAGLARLAVKGAISEGSLMALSHEAGSSLLVSALERLVTLSPAERIALINDAMTRDRADIDAVGYVQTHLSLFKQSLAGYAAYQPGIFAGDVVVLRPESRDPILPWLSGTTAEYLGNLCLGKVTVETVPGNPSNCLHPPQINALAKAVLSIHDQAEQGT